MKNVNALILAAVLCCHIPPAFADNGMWFIGADMCRANYTNCTNGLVNQNDVRSYVSKTECEQEAETYRNLMQSSGAVVNRVWCEQK
jgi:hypothetical protein